MPFAVTAQVADVLLLGGRVIDGTGNPWVQADIAVSGDRISFVGHASSAGVAAHDTVDVTGLLVTPGFWDMHSHAEVEEHWGRGAEAYLYQGITTAVLGVDGFGPNNIAELFDGYRTNGIGLNVIRYVGHNSARRSVMGADDRAPSMSEIASMESYVREGMEAGAVGLSSGLFYVPGSYASTGEVIALNRVSAEYGGVYDTHDRDLGAAYESVGYDASVEEAIEIGESAGTPVIFSHFNPQGRQNYGRASVGVALIEAARARGVNVMAAQHVYTATQSSLSAYAIPRWASAGGMAAMRERFMNPETQRQLDIETMEMLDIRGGPEKIFFSDPRPELNGKTLDQVAADMNAVVPAAVRQILAGGNAGVMNLELYDIENTRYLAQQDWMMTCTDGRAPPSTEMFTHPRPYGAFTRKIRLFVREDSVISMPFAVRGMTSLGATFLGIQDRGLIREGFYADIAVFDEPAMTDRATYDDPHQYSEGTVHVLVNGTFAVHDGVVTGELAGRPIPRGGS